MTANESIARSLATSNDRKIVVETAMFEAEVWVRGLERYFHVGNLPLSQEQERSVLELDFSPELKVAGEALMRSCHLIRQVLGERRVNLLKFRQYVEESIIRNEGKGSYLKAHEEPATEEWRLGKLLEDLSALLQVQSDLARSGSISVGSFQAYGRLLGRLVRDSRVFGSLWSTPFRRDLDRVDVPRVGAVVRGIKNNYLRREVARLMLTFFRFLRYLDLIRDELARYGPNRRTLVIFVLLRADTEVLLQFLRKVVLKRLPNDESVTEVLDSLWFGAYMELKKVFERELVGFAALKEPEAIYVRIEDAHGMMKEAYQQGIVTVMQAFDGNVRGRDVFPNFVTKREQSELLLRDLESLREMVEGIQRESEFEALFKLMRRMDRFQQVSLRHLMYKDWSVFASFQEELHSCKNLQNLRFVTHRLAAYIGTLIEEVSKRSVLREEQV